MATLIRPRRWGKQKPPPGSRIDRGHPLAQDLLGCWLCNERSGILHDIAGPRSDLTPAAAATWRPQGLFCGLTTDNGAWVDTPQRFRVTTSTTLVWWGVVMGANIGNSDLIGISPHATDTDPYTANNLARSYESADKINALWNNAGSFGGWSDNGIDVGLSTRYNRPLMFALVFDLGSGDRHLYDGAKLIGTQGGGSAPTYGATSLTNIGCFYPIPSQYSNSVTFAGAYWARALTAQEIAWLYAEPYAFINPPAPKLLYYAVGAGAAAPADNPPYSSPYPQLLAH